MAARWNTGMASVRSSNPIDDCCRMKETPEKIRVEIAFLESLLEHSDTVWAKRITIQLENLNKRLKEFTKSRQE